MKNVLKNPKNNSKHQKSNKKFKIPKTYRNVHKNDTENPKNNTKHEKSNKKFKIQKTYMNVHKNKPKTPLYTFFFVRFENKRNRGGHPVLFTITKPIHNRSIISTYIEEYNP